MSTHRRPWRGLPQLFAAVALTVVATLGGTAPAANAVTGNLVANGDFSASGTGWNLDPNGGVETCCAAPPVGYPNAFAHPNGAGGFIGTWQAITSTPPGTYTLSGRIRTSGGVQQAWIQADNGDFNGRWCQTPATNVTGWTSFTCTFSFTSGTIHVALAAANTAAAAWGWIAYDDISLVSTGVIGATSYDLAAYMMRTDGLNGQTYQFSSGETMQIQYDAGSGRYYQVKNANWEEMSYNSSYIVRYRDSSLDDDEWYGLYTGTTLGSNWAPRTMTVGQTFDRNPMVRFYYKSGCGVSRTAGQQGTQIRLITQYPSLNINGYTISDVILLRGLIGGAAWEDFYYARGLGLVRFVAYDPPGSGTVVMNNAYSGSGGAQPTRLTLCNP